MKMKSQRKIERDRVKREVSRSRAPRHTQKPEDGDDDAVDELDLQVARSVLGYDE